MNMQRALECVGQTVTFWDDFSDIYREGILIEVDASGEATVDCGRVYTVMLSNLHLGTLDEVTEAGSIHVSDDELAEELLRDTSDPFVDLESDVDPKQYGDPDDDTEL